jgi:hypothetical protein
MPRMAGRFSLCWLSAAGCCLSVTAERQPAGDAGAPSVHDVFAAVVAACTACGVADYLCQHGVAHAEAFFGRAADAGRISFSEDVAAACISALGHAPCASMDDSKAPSFYPAPLPESCLSLFERSGAVSLGGPCFADALGFHGEVPDLGVGYAYLDECAGGICSSFFGTACPGTCELPTETGIPGCGPTCDAGAGGASCSEDPACAVGFYCASQGGSCEPQVGAGVACGGSEFLGGDPVAALPECGWGLVCLVGPDDGGVCTAPRVDGAACKGEGVVGDPGCQFGLFCSAGSCTRLPETGSAVSLIGYGCDPTLSYEDLSGQCRPLLDAGAPCGASAWCASGVCRSTCQPVPCTEP